jgi:phage terminase small subunit
MAQGTEIKTEQNFTLEESKDIAYLLKHPSIKKLIDEIKQKEVNK